jgi:hypothetical protein
MNTIEEQHVRDKAEIDSCIESYERNLGRKLLFDERLMFCYAFGYFTGSREVRE